MVAPNILTQRQFRITIAAPGVFVDPGLWDILSGSGMSTSASETWPAGEKTVVRLQGPTIPKPITISRTYNPTRDDPIISAIRMNPGAMIHVTRTPLNKDSTPAGVQTVWTDCFISEMNDPASDTGSGEAARFELVLQPTSMR